MKKPVVAVIGRPNVGKSTLVNRIIGSRKAIVDDQPGVTRDRSYYPAEWLGRDFELVDTGGIVPDSKEFFDELVNRQVDVAMAEADTIVFLVDGRDGVTALDELVAARLRQAKKPVILAVNKIDTPEQKHLVNDFYSLGLGDPQPASAMHGFGGVGDLLDVIIATFPEPEEEGPEVEDADQPIRVAIVGRPNVGKSSILNALAGMERSIVSDIPGTTRDAVETVLVHADRQFIIVDTAGIRKKGKVGYGIEMFSVDRSLRAITEADVTVVVIDATEGVTDQDKKIIERSNEKGCGLVIVVNKWDLVPQKTTKSTDDYKKTLFHQLPHASFAKVVFTSAETGQRLPQILDRVIEAYENAHRRVKTNLVNQVVSEAVSLSPPPPVKNRLLKILYATQASAGPPTFILFANDAKLMKDAYRRYLEKKLRESFEFTGTPLRLVARTRGEKKG